MTTALIIFVLTYALISARRLNLMSLDRPSGSLAGAVLCVAFGVLTPGRALAAIDENTLLLLFGMMGIGAFLEVDGFFDRLSRLLVRWCGTPSAFLGAVVWGSGILSALITNDSVCVLGAPVVVKLIRKNGLAPFPFLLALATSANIGSVATLVGNPQNMLCAHLGNLSYSGYLAVMGPVAVMGLAMNHLLLRVLFRTRLRGELVREPGETAVTPKMAVTLSVLAGTVVLFMAGANLAWTAVGGFTTLFFIHRHETRKIWDNIDWSILLFFAGLFIVVEGLFQSGAVAYVFGRFPLRGLDSWTLPFVFLAGSNVVSNVPFILVVQDQIAGFPDPKPVWELLAMASTFGGNLTLIGSVANIIVAEKARDIGGMGFWEYLKVGFPLAVLTTAMGFAWLSHVYPSF